MDHARDDRRRALGDPMGRRAVRAAVPGRTTAHFPAAAECAGLSLCRDFSQVRVRPPQASGPLPHGDAIDRAFGPDHDLSRVSARVGGPAVGWNALLGARASTRGDEIFFSGPPTPAEVAHEATHVVQQRRGNGVPGQVSRPDDPDERLADEVAERVDRHQPVTELLGAPAPPTRRTDPPVQRRLIAHGSETDLARFFALAEPAAGVQLYRDRKTDVVTSVASLAAPPTSPTFSVVLRDIVNDPAQDTELRLGEHQSASGPGGGRGGVFVGAYPFAAPPVEQVIDLDDLEAIEAGAPGRGVAFLAHELEENAIAHSLPPGAAGFPIAHAAAAAVEEGVSEEVVGPGQLLLSYLAAGPHGDQRYIQDYSGYFVVVDVGPAAVPPDTSAPPDTLVRAARHVAQTVVSTAVVDGIATGLDTVPATAGPAVAAAAAALAADPTAAAHVEGFTDDVGSAANNSMLGARRADNGRALFPAHLQGRVAAIGQGATAFVQPNTNPANRAHNRRIVITVVRP